MGYFEGLTSSSFKATQDGRWLFFPWGVLGGGYDIASAEAYQRLRRQIKAYMIATLVLIIGTVSLLGPIACFIMAAGPLAFYLGWMCYLLPRLQYSGEKMSLQESMTSQARAHSVFGLRAMQIGSLVLMAGGIMMLVSEPDQRLMAAFTILFFGFCLAKITRMLSLRRVTQDAER